MHIVDALLKQAPSLELQRAAADEIARLSKEVKEHRLFQSTLYLALGKGAPVNRAEWPLLINKMRTRLEDV